MQAAWWNGKQVGLWISRHGLESLDRSLHLSGLSLPSPRSPRSCSFFNCLEGHEEHKACGSHGTLFSLPRDTLAHLPFHRASCHLHEVRRLQGRDYILVTEKSDNGGCLPIGGKHEETDLFQIHILLPYTFLKSVVSSLSGVPDLAHYIFSFLSWQT